MLIPRYVGFEGFRAESWNEMKILQVFCSPVTTLRPAETPQTGEDAGGMHAPNTRSQLHTHDPTLLRNPDLMSRRLSRSLVSRMIRYTLAQICLTMPLGKSSCRSRPASRKMRRVDLIHSNLIDSGHSITSPMMVGIRRCSGVNSSRSSSLAKRWQLRHLSTKSLRRLWESIPRWTP